MRYQPSTFFHNFSIADLVRRDGSRFGVEYPGGGTGGGGSHEAVGTHASGSREAVYGKSESFSCRPWSAGRGEFDEAGFIASLKEAVRDEVAVGRARVTGEGDMGASGFFFDYGGEGVRGRVIISGLLTQGGNYHLSASLHETSTSETRPAQLRESEDRPPSGQYHVVAFASEDPRPPTLDFHEAGVAAVKESTERLRRKLVSDPSRRASLIQNLEHAEVYVWKRTPPEVRRRFGGILGEELEAPAGYERYEEVYFLNDVALRMYRDAGVKFEVSKTISGDEVPAAAHRTLGGPYVPEGE